MISNKLKRQENKYFINYLDYNYIKNDISKVMRRDDNCHNNLPYEVRSLYFDNFDYKCIEEKLAGEKYRSKYRLRVYNKNFDNIKLEVKIKNNSISFKKSFKVDKQFCVKLINNYDLSIKDIADHELKNQIIYMKHNWFKPVSIVNYEREAFFFNSKNFLRITFDKNITSELSNLDFFNLNYQRQKIFINDLVVMEVKFKNYIPNFIVDILQKYSIARSAISKYVLSYKFRQFNTRDLITENF